jgi:hypothetical protein
MQKSTDVAMMRTQGKADAAKSPTLLARHAPIHYGIVPALPQP